MSQKVFVPLTDELLYDHPELITAPLRPFNAGQPCFHWMANWKENGITHVITNAAPGVMPEISEAEKSAS